MTRTSSKPHFAWLAAALVAAACTAHELPPSHGGDASGKTCGSRGLAPCADGEFCEFPESAQCGETDVPGVCTPVPSACTREYMPVCGCDGKTYATACTAAASSVSVRAKGECASEPDGGPSAKICGGLAGFQCGEGEFCSFPSEARCGAADQTGLCTKKPEACIMLYKPVCGCDGKTYGNACNAANQGISVAHEGEC